MLFIRALEGCCAAVTFVAVLYIAWLVGPPIETRYNPVLGTMEIISLVWDDGGQSSQVVVEFRKRRTCEFVGIAWYERSGDGPLSRVQLQLRPDGVMPPTRAPGLQRAGPWKVFMPAAFLRARSHVLAFHRCHPLWLTTSVLHP